MPMQYNTVWLLPGWNHWGYFKILEWIFFRVEFAWIRIQGCEIPCKDTEFASEPTIFGRRPKSGASELLSWLPFYVRIGAGEQAFVLTAILCANRCGRASQRSLAVGQSRGRARFCPGCHFMCESVLSSLSSPLSFYHLSIDDWTLRNWIYYVISFLLV